MIRIEWTDKRGMEQSTEVEHIKLWEARGGNEVEIDGLVWKRKPEHPDGTVIEGYRDGIGVIQLDADDRVGTVTIREVE